VIDPQALPTDGQTATLIMSALAFAVSAGASIARQWTDSRLLRITVWVAGWGGVVLGAAVLGWHAATAMASHGLAGTGWMPLEDNFDALAWLGVMIAGCALYVQWRRPVGGLDWFVLPVGIALLVAAAVFGREEPRAYRETAWSVVHRVTAYGGALALTIAGVVGAMYLVANHRLRAKRMIGGTGLGSLERLENVAQTAVTLGWPLFTIGLVTGVIWGIHLGSMDKGHQQEFFEPKILLAVAGWVVFALALHTPINASFRGRKAAVLSLIGLVLMIGTLLAVQFMPAGPR